MKKGGFIEVIRRFIILIGFLLFFFSFITSSYAADGQTYEVGTTPLNVRSAPSSNGEIIGFLSKGDQIATFGEKHGWIQTYYAGQEAWVASQFLFPVQDGTPQEQQNQNNVDQPSQEAIQVHTNGVHIRSGAGTNSDVISTSQAGSTYHLIETSGDWHHIKLDDGSTGWIASWLADSPTSSTADTTEDTTPIVQAQEQPQQQKQSPNGSLEGLTIVLDPGHGGKDPGSIGLDGVQEKELVMTISEKVAQELRAAGADVVLTRTGDYFVSLEQRAGISNDHQADAFISLHYNAFPVITVQGINTYFYSNGANHELASEIQSSLAKNITMQNRGIDQADFHVLPENNNLPALIELGFITNPDELLTIQTADYQNGVANGITNGLINYFN